MHFKTALIAAFTLASTALAQNSLTMDVYAVGDCSILSPGTPTVLITDTGCTNIQNSIPSGFRLRDFDFAPGCRLVFSTKTDCSTFDAVIDPNDFQCFTTRGIGSDFVIQNGGNARMFCS